MTLEQFFKEHPRCALGFSGGVDSSYLLWAAVQAGIDVQPYFIKTPFQPEFELEDAKKLARQLGVELRVVPLRLPEPVLENPSNRCYLCKQALFGTLWQLAAREGYGVLLDGTNASDDPADRPGMRALEELEVLSPLRLCGLNKRELRRRSREAGLFTWDKPAYACLATRFPTGTSTWKTPASPGPFRGPSFTLTGRAPGLPPTSPRSQLWARWSLSRLMPPPASPSRPSAARRAA